MASGATTTSTGSANVGTAFRLLGMISSQIAPLHNLRTFQKVPPTGGVL